MGKVEIIKRGIVYKPKGKLSYCGWPTISRLQDGNLMAVFSGSRLKHVCPFGKTVACYSRDNGKTWTNPTEIINTPFDDRDGGVAVKGKQVLVTSFNNTLEFQRSDVERDAKHKQMINDYCDLFQDADVSQVCSSIAVSEDGGYVFGENYSVPITAPHGPIVLKDGRYCYVGTAFRPIVCDYSKLAFKPLENGIYCMFSDDGYNWTQPQLVFLNNTMSTWCEPHVIELENGELLVQIRVQLRADESFDKMYIYQTVSSDNITKWSEPVSIGVDGAPPFLLRHSSGAIVCVYGKRTRPIAEMATISYDEGKTWSEPFVIDGDAENGDMGYPSSIEMEDGSIFTIYYQHEQKGENNYVKYTHWALGENYEK